VPRTASAAFLRRFRLTKAQQWLQLKGSSARRTLNLASAKKTAKLDQSRFPAGAQVSTNFQIIRRGIEAWRQWTVTKKGRAEISKGSYGQIQLHSQLATCTQSDFLKTRNPTLITNLQLSTNQVWSRDCCSSLFKLPRRHQYSSSTTWCSNHSKENKGFNSKLLSRSKEK